jgi:PBP1b-binding outer membrane lipoprotein LpoB
MKNKAIILTILLSTMVIGGCGANLPASNKEGAQEKVERNVVTKSGEIKSKLGDEWLLQTPDGIVNITSSKVNLDSYMKKKVTVTGMFSGSTLYVDEIK